MSELIINKLFSNQSELSKAVLLLNIGTANDIQIFYSPITFQVFFHNNGLRPFQISYNGNYFVGQSQESAFRAPGEGQTLDIEPGKDAYFSNEDNGGFDAKFSPQSSGQYVTLANITLSILTPTPQMYALDMNNNRFNDTNWIHAVGGPALT